MSGADGDSITLHSSWRGLISGTVGGVVVAAAGTLGVSQVGFRPIPGVLFVVGWVLVLVVTLDYPVASTFTRDGVQRRMMLRRQWFAWDDVDQLSRTRPTLIRVDRRFRHGGLVVVKGRRRYLLVDRLESDDEHARLVEIVEGDGDGADVGASMLPSPGERVPPTWLYRRSHWRPDSARGR